GAILLMLVPTGTGPPGVGPGGNGAAASGVGLAAPSAPNSFGGWVTDGGSANRSGYTPLGGPLSVATGNVYCPSSYPLRTGVVATGPLVYTADVFGDVFAINRTQLDAGGGNGTVVWRASVGNAPTTPDVSSGFLVIGDADGAVTALDLRTGAVQWVHTFASPVLTGIAVVNGTVYLGTLNGTVAAVALAGGRTNWTVSAGGPLSGAVAVSGGRVFAATSVGGLVAFSAGTGARLWNITTGRLLSPGVGPAVYGNRVVLAANATAVASYAAQNGSLQWLWNGAGFAPRDRIEAEPTLSGTTVFVQTHEGNLYGINATTGILRWNESNPQFVAGYPVYSAAASTPSVLYAYDATQQLKAISLATGRVLWRATFLSVSYGPVAI
ncbi:MAG: PQQ-binding-like beta-propeller repeat protein, partial [Candidatus Lutacidiplasmatales archaeon]